MEPIFPAYTSSSNASLIPPYREDQEVELLRSDENGLLFSPDWVSSLILMEIHPETATKEGTLESLLPVLDHCAALGVNGIWLTPIYKKGPGGNGYGNWGPDTLEPTVTGTQDTAEGWKRVHDFIAKAHQRNIRIFLDIVSWGCVYSSPLIALHPAWFKGEAWGGAAFNWENEELREWFIGVCVHNILVSGADGYRCDCEPVFTGYRVYSEVRTRLLTLGRKIAIIAEESSERKSTYDMEQDGITGWIDWSRGEQYQHPKAYFLEGINLVESIKTGVLHGDAASQKSGTSGQNRYYTYCVSNHDYQKSRVNCNRLVIGYQAIFAPFIPLWYLGSEFGMYADQRVIYDIPVDWTLLEKENNRSFCADLARYLRIRLLYPDIFCFWPLDHRAANICKLDADTQIQSYARYAGNHAILIVPHADEPQNNFCVQIHLSDLNFSDGGQGEYRIKDLLGTDTVEKPICHSDVLSFSAHVEKQHLGVYLLTVDNHVS